MAIDSNNTGVYDWASMQDERLESESYASTLQESLRATGQLDALSSDSYAEEVFFAEHHRPDPFAELHAESERRKGVATRVKIAAAAITVAGLFALARSGDSSDITIDAQSPLSDSNSVSELDIGPLQTAPGTEAKNSTVFVESADSVPQTEVHQMLLGIFERESANTALQSLVIPDYAIESTSSLAEWARIANIELQPTTITALDTQWAQSYCDAQPETEGVAVCGTEADIITLIGQHGDSRFSVEDYARAQLQHQALLEHQELTERKSVAQNRLDNADISRAVVEERLEQAILAQQLPGSSTQELQTQGVNIVTAQAELQTMIDADTEDQRLIEELDTLLEVKQLEIDSFVGEIRYEEYISAITDKDFIIDVLADQRAELRERLKDQLGGEATTTDILILGMVEDQNTSVEDLLRLLVADRLVSFGADFDLAWDETARRAGD